VRHLAALSLSSHCWSLSSGYQVLEIHKSIAPNFINEFNIFLLFGTILVGSLTYSRAEDYLQKIIFNESVV